jgi:hypothetical protein
MFEFVPSMAFWTFGAIALIGVVFLLLTFIFGELSEGLGGIFEGLDGAFEGLGLDFFPESVEIGDGSGGVGCGIVAAFMAGFGLIGLAVTMMGGGAGASLLAAVVSGVLAGGLYFGLMSFLIGQQSSSTIEVADFTGRMARVSTNVPRGDIGDGFLELRGQRNRYPLREVQGKALKRGDLVIVERFEGGILFVRKDEA